MARADERMGILPLLPVSSSSGQCPIGNWQHLHIGNILETHRYPMRQMVGRARRARRKVPQTQHHRRIIADGSESRPYHANLPRWYFHFAPNLSLMRLIAASAAGARRLSHFIKCDSRGMSEKSPRSPTEPMAIGASRDRTTSSAGDCLTASNPLHHWRQLHILPSGEG